MDDSGQLATLVEAHADALLLYARQWNDAIAEDVVQEAFLRLIREPQMPTSPKSWLYRVVRNEMIDRLRHQQMRQRVHSIIANDWFEPPPDKSREDAEELAVALKRLPDQQREIIVAKIWSDLTYDEIAALMNLSKSHVHRLYHEGLSTLRTFFER